MVASKSVFLGALIYATNQEPVFFNQKPFMYCRLECLYVNFIICGAYCLILTKIQSNHLLLKRVPYIIAIIAQMFIALFLLEFGMICVWCRFENFVYQIVSVVVDPEHLHNYVGYSIATALIYSIQIIFLYYASIVTGYLKAFKIFLKGGAQYCQMKRYVKKVLRKYGSLRSMKSLVKELKRSAQQAQRSLSGTNCQ